MPSSNKREPRDPTIGDSFGDNVFRRFDEGEKVCICGGDTSTGHRPDCPLYDEGRGRLLIVIFGFLAAFWICVIVLLVLTLV